jgi:hypothetical protein
MAKQRILRELQINKLNKGFFHFFLADNAMIGFIIFHLDLLPGMI